MTVKAERIKAELTQLTPADQAELIRFLIGLLDGKEEQVAEAVWDQELSRRAEEISSDRVAGEPADNILRELRAKYS